MVETTAALHQVSKTELGCHFLALFWQRLALITIHLSRSNHNIPLLNREYPLKIPYLVATTTSLSASVTFFLRAASTHSTQRIHHMSSRRSESHTLYVLNADHFQDPYPALYRYPSSRTCYAPSARASDALFFSYLHPFLVPKYEMTVLNELFLSTKIHPHFSC